MIECRNCGAALHGRYCHACGQKAGTAEVTLNDLMHEGVHEFVHLDGKIFQTLKLLLFRPGELTTEFLAGRRARYIPPLRLYLVCSLVFFALAAWTRSPFIDVHLTKDDIADSAEREATQQAIVARLEHLRDEMTHNTPRAMFVLMPVFGLLSWACYRRSQPYYVPHLYYAIHFHAFVFLMFAIKEGCSFGGRVGDAVGGVFPLTIVPYHYLALRRVFGGTRWQVAWKGTLIALLYSAIILSIMVALLVITMKSAGSSMTPKRLHLP
jgi:Protein of unknown function (DUF3667)